MFPGRMGLWCRHCNRERAGLVGETLGLTQSACHHSFILPLVKEHNVVWGAKKDPLFEKKSL